MRFILSLVLVFNLGCASLTYPDGGEASVIGEAKACFYEETWPDGHIIREGCVESEGLSDNFLAAFSAITGVLAGLAIFVP